MFHFLGHPVHTIVNCSLLVFGVVVIVKRHNGRLGLVDDRVLGGEVENQQELIQNQNYCALQGKNNTGEDADDSVLVFLDSPASVEV